MNSIKQILQECLGNRFSKQEIDDLVFHIRESLHELAELKRVLDLVETTDLAYTKEPRREVKKVFTNLIVHGSNHLIAAGFLFHQLPLNDRFECQIFEDDPEIEEALFIPCPDIDCERPIDQCICRAYAPIPLDQLEPIQRCLYINLFNGDTEPDRLRKVADHMTAWKKELANWLNLFHSSTSKTDLPLNAIQILNEFLSVVPEHLAAVQKLYHQTAIIDVFGLGLIN
ncbi:hypothetical protein [Nitrincola tapanii]|uniref:Uncharacterized protein n=1 Tax=Nitrincola tapanii TaxID=1708751 RepID=A0A5A9W6X1_9GAMM|nr:hypothetical protein [Nitrincola tapanii]KAA0876466.1 hypothetical protein E1H14_01705 [Nitrincola tapanii]